MDSLAGGIVGVLLVLVQSLDTPNSRTLRYLFPLPFFHLRSLIGVDAFLG